MRHPRSQHQSCSRLSGVPFVRVLSPCSICSLSSFVKMSQDYLSHLPLEILQDTLRFLDSLDFLRCRQVNSSLRCGVESLPEYVAYRATHDRAMKLYYEGTRKRGVWQAAGICRFVDLMRVKNPPSDRKMLVVLKCHLARETVALVGS